MPSLQYDRQLRFGIRLEQFEQFDVAHFLNHFLWFWPNWFFAWFCRRSCWRACRSEWFSIFWINSRTLVLCACFTTESIMFTSFSIVCSWLDSSWFTTGCPVQSRIVSSPTLKLMLSWKERVWEPSGTLFVCVSTTGCTVLSFATSTLRLLLSSDERVFGSSCFNNNVLPRSIVFDSFLREKNVCRSAGNGTFFFYLARFSC